MKLPENFLSIEVDSEFYFLAIFRTDLKDYLMLNTFLQSIYWI